MIIPNEGIYDDGHDHAYLHNGDPSEHPYKEPHLSFQKYSWFAGYADGLMLRLEWQEDERQQKANQ